VKLAFSYARIARPTVKPRSSSALDIIHQSPLRHPERSRGISYRDHCLDPAIVIDRDDHQPLYTHQRCDHRRIGGMRSLGFARDDVVGRTLLPPADRLLDRIGDQARSRPYLGCRSAPTGALASVPVRCAIFPRDHSVRCPRDDHLWTAHLTTKSYRHTMSYASPRSRAERLDHLPRRRA
jgi:hypothetical protein